MYYGRQEIIHISGEQGARNYQLPPSSNALLLDDTAPLVWLCQTDAIGYKTVTPYKIEPYTPPTPVDINTLLEKINVLEERLNESNNTTNEPVKRTRNKTVDADE